jgi:hypothetical protein
MLMSHLAQHWHETNETSTAERFLHKAEEAKRWAELVYVSFFPINRL